MGLRNVYKKGLLPPCPDPASYILVRTADGYYYWRRKRGTVKPAVLNDVFQKNADLKKINSPAASRILKRLNAFMDKFNKGRTYQEIIRRLYDPLKAKGKIDFSAMQDLELNYNHALDHLLINHYTVEEKNGHAVATIQQYAGGVKKLNKLVTEYFYELIIVWGDATKDGGLQLRHTSSLLYSFSDKNLPVCELELPLPTNQQPWMVLLKAGCLEGNEMASHCRHYGMRVVMTG